MAVLQQVEGQILYQKLHQNVNVELILLFYSKMPFLDRVNRNDYSTSLGSRMTANIAHFKGLMYF